MGIETSCEVSNLNIHAFACVGYIFFLSETLFLRKSVYIIYSMTLLSHFLFVEVVRGSCL